MQDAIAHLNPQDVLTVSSDQIRTTSFKVAEVFGRQHRDLVRKIKSLECSEQFLTANFYAVKYNHRGNDYDAYEMTKDGFMFLVMGFTGKKAAAIKEAYINAFNWMAEQLQKQQSQQAGRYIVPADPHGMIPTLPPHLVVVNRQDLENLINMNKMSRERLDAVMQAREDLNRAIGAIHDPIADSWLHALPLVNATKH